MACNFSRSRSLRIKLISRSLSSLAKSYVSRPSSLTPSVSSLTRPCISFSNCFLVSNNVSAACFRNSFRCFFSFSGSVLGMEYLTHQIIFQSISNFNIDEISELRWRVFLRCSRVVYENKTVYFGCVGLSSPGQFAGLVINIINHNSLNGPNQGLVLFLCNGGLEIHHFLPTRFFLLIRNLAIYSNCGGTFLLRIFEDA